LKDLEGQAQPGSLRRLKRMNGHTWLHCLLRHCAWRVLGREIVGISCITPAGLPWESKRCCHFKYFRK